MSVSIALRSLVSVIVLLGTVAALLPWLIVDSPSRPHGERTFGDEYRSYRASVSRWLPRMP